MIGHRTHLPSGILAALLLAAAAFGWTAVSLAAEADDPGSDTEDTAPVGESDGSEAAGDNAGADAEPENPGVFVPSEEISEDFAVSFPVDI